MTLFKPFPYKPSDKATTTKDWQQYEFYFLRDIKKAKKSC